MRTARSQVTPRIQSLNRYAYVLNNPSTLIDPTGLFAPGPCIDPNAPDCVWATGGGGPIGTGTSGFIGPSGTGEGGNGGGGGGGGRGPTPLPLPCPNPALLTLPSTVLLPCVQPNFLQSFVINGLEIHPETGLSEEGKFA